MSLKIEKFTTKPEDVEAVLVTRENMGEVASWVGVVLVGHQHGTGPSALRIPMSEEHDYAFVGDWVTKTDWVWFKSCQDFNGSLNPERFDRVVDER